MKLFGKTVSIEKIRENVANELRSRVVGPNASQRTHEIMEAPGERWFAEDRPIRLVHGDASMFIGGLRALLHGLDRAIDLRKGPAQVQQ